MLDFSCHYEETALLIQEQNNKIYVTRNKGGAKVGSCLASWSGFLFRQTKQQVHGRVTDWNKQSEINARIYFLKKGKMRALFCERILGK